MTLDKTTEWEKTSHFEDKEKVDKTSTFEDKTEKEANNANFEDCRTILKGDLYHANTTFAAICEEENC